MIIIFHQIIKIIPKSHFSFDKALEKNNQKTTLVKIGDQSLIFRTPNWITTYRAKTLETKEPETIAWINSFKPNSIFYDVGANVGIFSCYAAFKNKCEVFAFEPSPPNLEMLISNITLNNLSERICIIPFGLSELTKQARIYYSRNSFSWGGAHNSVDLKINQRGETLKDTIDIKTISYNLDDLIRLLKLPSPRYLKIDVDGIENVILRGCQEAFKTIESILVENDSQNRNSESEIHSILKKANFERTSFNTENQIWVKNSSGKI